MGVVDPVELTRALIRCPSVTPNEAGALGVLEEALRAHGARVQRRTFGAGGAAVENLWAQIGTDGPHLAFLGHVDVVAAGPRKRWSVDPFAGEQRNGELLGRGAVDMKGAIAAFVAALSRYRQAPHGTVSLLVTCDEEGPAEHGTRALLAALTAEGVRFDAAIVGEPTCPERLGDAIKIGRRGSMNVELSVRGKQGHTAYPELADNAVHRLVGMLQALIAMRLDEGSEHFAPSSLQVATMETANRISNVVPGDARALINIRYNDRHTSASLEQILRARLDAAGGGYTLEARSSGDAFVSKPGRLVAVLAGAIEAETGRRPVLSTSGGTSDARFMRQYCPTAEFGLVGRTMHQVDERVAVADLHLLTSIYERFLGHFFEAA